jgi:hypothetical protein
VLTIRLDTELASFAATVNEAGRGQLRFAASQALTQVARQTNAAVARELLPTAFDRPTPFTLNAFRVLPATKQSMAAQILLKTPQEAAGYAALLRLEEHGGTRQARAITTPVPTGLRLNAYGNLRKGATRAAASRRNTFWAKPGDVKHNRFGGLYQRVKGGKLKLLVSFRSQVAYRPRFAFHPFVAARARTQFPAAMATAFARAMATKRRL